MNNKKYFLDFGEIEKVDGWFESLSTVAIVRELSIKNFTFSGVACGKGDLSSTFFYPTAIKHKWRIKIFHKRNKNSHIEYNIHIAITSSGARFFESHGYNFL